MTHTSLLLPPVICCCLPFSLSLTHTQTHIHTLQTRAHVHTLNTHTYTQALHTHTYTRVHTPRSLLPAALPACRHCCPDPDPQGAPAAAARGVTADAHAPPKRHLPEGGVRGAAMPGHRCGVWRGIRWALVLFLTLSFLILSSSSSFPSFFESRGAEPPCLVIGASW